MLGSGQRRERQLTLVEQVEEILLGFCGAVSSQQANKRLSGSSARLSKKWYETHRRSFELQKFSSKDEWRVKLVDAAEARSEGRIRERDAEKQRVRELQIAEQVLPKLSADSLPRTLNAREFAAMLCVLPQCRAAQGVPSALLSRLCHGEKTPADLLRDAAPFPAALLMKAIVMVDKHRKQRWPLECLETVCNAAALDLHVMDDRSQCTLHAAAMTIWSAARRPFDEREGSRPIGAKLLASASFRLQMELKLNGSAPWGELFPAFRAHVRLAREHLGAGARAARGPPGRRRRGPCPTNRRRTSRVVR